MAEVSSWNSFSKSFSKMHLPRAAHILYRFITVLLQAQSCTTLSEDSPFYREVDALYVPFHRQQRFFRMVSPKSCLSCEYHLY